MDLMPEILRVPNNMIVVFLLPEWPIAAEKIVSLLGGEGFP